MSTDEQKAKFLDTLESLGGSAGNASLRDVLGWQESTYERVKEALIEEGRIARGRGRGGSVQLLEPELAIPAPAGRAREQMAPARPTPPPAAPKPAPTLAKPITTYRHTDDTRRNIPTAELETVMRDEDRSPIQVAYARRNRDLDPQLVWRGKDMQDWSDLIVQAPPLYIQEKVHPQALIEDIRRRGAKPSDNAMPDLFADFNGLKDRAAATDFYRHDQHWSNRMILGDSLTVMASLAEREGLRGQVQCIYFDPPYGIKFNSNFQWSTTTRDVKDGDKSHLTREPEQVRAFRDTWRDGVHSYLSYLRDRLTVARDLLNESGSIFVQIGDENVHRIRTILDEVFGDENFVVQLAIKKTAGVMEAGIGPSSVIDYVIWYAKNNSSLKARKIYGERSEANAAGFTKLMLPGGIPISARDATPEQLRIGRPFLFNNLYKSGPGAKYDVEWEGEIFNSGSKWWGTKKETLVRALRANKVRKSGSNLSLVVYADDFPVQRLINYWSDAVHLGDRYYVVQTGPKVIERCILMATDPGDVVLDPTCGSGTTAYVAEQWGRRWVTIDTSRVALALARSRLMGARYPFYILADSPEGQRKEAEVTRAAPKTTPTSSRLRQGFVYERVPHITLKSIANNAEIDVIWEAAQATLEPLRAELNTALRNAWEEWEIPRDADPAWPEAAKQAHAGWWAARIQRQKDIDASIAAKAEVEYLYDRPYEDPKRIRVAGPFTVESLSPHRALTVNWDDELIDPQQKPGFADGQDGMARDFAGMILENLRTAGVQQADRGGRITFTSLTPWPGHHVCAEGRYREGDDGPERRAGILIGPEFGTVSRPDLVAAAREAADAGFDVLIACAFAYDAHSTDFDRLGRVTVLRARMNPDLHMAQDLKATKAGNLFVIFGEPDVRIETLKDGQLRVKIRGVDVFKPQSGEIESEGTDKIALWMIDTDYNEESFFVRHAYFLGANDPYKALKTTLKAEIDAAAWSSLNSDTSYPFPKPASGRIAVKVINHLGDEVMKVFAV
jgi:adenine-specific DNA-methyltransferase